MKGKVAAITGGSGTLGKAFAKGLAEQGASVFILSRNQEKANQAIEEFRTKGLELVAIKCDVLDSFDCLTSGPIPANPLELLASERFAKGLAAGLGFSGEVTSPTFSLVHEYRGGRLPAFHFDFYRIDSADELIALGWDDYLDESGVCVVEWADKYPDLLPEKTRWLRFSLLEDGTRRLAIDE